MTSRPLTRSNNTNREEDPDRSFQKTSTVKTARSNDVVVVGRQPGSFALPTTTGPTNNATAQQASAGPTFVEASFRPYSLPSHLFPLPPSSPSLPPSAPSILFSASPADPHFLPMPSMMYSMTGRPHTAAVAVAAADPHAAAMHARYYPTPATPGGALVMDPHQLHTGGQPPQHYTPPQQLAAAGSLPFSSPSRSFVSTATPPTSSSNSPTVSATSQLNNSPSTSASASLSSSTTPSTQRSTQNSNAYGAGSASSISIPSGSSPAGSSNHDSGSVTPVTPIYQRLSTVKPEFHADTDGLHANYNSTRASMLPMLVNLLNWDEQPDDPAAADATITNVGGSVAAPITPSRSTLAGPSVSHFAFPPASSVRREAHPTLLAPPLPSLGHSPGTIPNFADQQSRSLLLSMSSMKHAASEEDVPLDSSAKKNRKRTFTLDTPQERHNLAEQKRRNQMKKGFERLQALLPEREFKMTKVALLNESAHYLQRVQELACKLIAENDELKKKLALYEAQTAHLGASPSSASSSLSSSSSSSTTLLSSPSLTPRLAVLPQATLSSYSRASNNNSSTDGNSTSSTSSSTKRASVEGRATTHARDTKKIRRAQDEGQMTTDEPEEEGIDTKHKRDHWRSFTNKDEEVEEEEEEEEETEEQINEKEEEEVDIEAEEDEEDHDAEDEKKSLETDMETSRGTKGSSTRLDRHHNVAKVNRSSARRTTPSANNKATTK
ncbi:hypothetical protein QOT17_007483 [Balamuthia mandrillaris]